MKRFILPIVVMCMLGACMSDAVTPEPTDEAASSPLPILTNKPTEADYSEADSEIVHPPECVIYVAGSAWIDWNENGTREQGEQGFPDVWLTLVNLDRNYEVSLPTDSKGDAELFITSVAEECDTLPHHYQVYPRIPEGYRLTTPEQIEGTYLEQNEWVEALFGFIPLDDAPTPTLAPNAMTCTPYPDLADREDAPLLALAATSDGTIWASIWHRGLARFDAAQGDWIFVDGFDEVEFIAEAPDGTLWLGTWHGVSHFDGQQWTSYTTDDGLISDLVTGVTFGLDGIVWFSTHSGVGGFNPATNDWGGYRIPSTYWKVSFQNAVTAPNGHIWFATLSDGAVEMIPPAHLGDRPAWNYYVTRPDDYSHLPDNITLHEADLNPLNTIQDLDIQPDGTIVIAGDDLAYINGSEWGEIDLTLFEYVTFLYVVSAAEDGSIWVGGTEGVVHLKGGDSVTGYPTQTLYNQWDGILPGEIVEIVPISSNEVWIGSESGPSHCMISD